MNRILDAQTGQLLFPMSSIQASTCRGENLNKLSQHAMKFDVQTSECGSAWHRDDDGCVIEISIDRRWVTLDRQALTSSLDGIAGFSAGRCADVEPDY